MTEDRLRASKALSSPCVFEDKAHFVWPQASKVFDFVECVPLLSQLIVTDLVVFLHIEMFAVVTVRLVLH